MQRAEALVPSSGQEHSKRINLLLKLKQFQEARGLAEAWIKEAPGAAEAWRLAGIAYLNLGQEAKGLATLEKAYALDPWKRKRARATRAPLRLAR